MTDAIVLADQILRAAEKDREQAYRIANRIIAAMNAEKASAATILAAISLAIVSAMKNVPVYKSSETVMDAIGIMALKFAELKLEFEGNGKLN